MKRSDLKELIKKSMLEVAPKKDSGAMTPEEEKMVADYEEEEANIARVSAILISPSKAYEIICSVYATIDSGNSSFNFDSELTKLNEKLITALSINPFGFKDAKSPTHGQEWKSVTSYLAAFKQIYNFSNDVYIPLN